MTVPRIDKNLTTTCRCGRSIVRVHANQPAVCPHTPDPALAVTHPGAPAGFAATVRALQDATAQLLNPAPGCTCPRTQIGDLDPDPDCPGLDDPTGGCRADARIRAWVTLAGAGIPYYAQSLHTERRALLHTLDHALTILADPTALTEALRDPHTVIVRADPHPNPTLEDAA